MPKALLAILILLAGYVVWYFSAVLFGVEIGGGWIRVGLWGGATYNIMLATNWAVDKVMER